MIEVMKGKDNPIVSIILPTYNRKDLIGRAIHSILNQSYQNFELIIIDDSTDNTIDVVNCFNDNRILYVRNNMKKGAASARNIGIKLAKGKYIAFQDSDDEWLVKKLEKQVKILDDKLEIDIVYTDMYRINFTGNKEYRLSPKVIQGKIINQKTLDYQVAGLGIQSTLIRKKCFDITGYFDENFPALEDLEFFIRMSTYFIFFHLKEPLVNYYVSEGLSTNKKAQFEARLLLLKKYRKFFHENKNFLGNQYCYIGYYHFLLGKKEFNKGRIYFLKAFSIDPFDTKPLLILVISLFGQNIFKKIINKYPQMRIDKEIY